MVPVQRPAALSPAAAYISCEGTRKIEENKGSRGFHGLGFNADVRGTNPDASAHRLARFRAGWAKAVQGTEYGEAALGKLTWDNLGWRFGKLLGFASTETVERMYQLCVKQHAESRPTIRVMSWNLRFPGRKRAAKLAGHVAALKWDVCLLQEVTQRAKEALKVEVAPSGCAFGIDWLSGSPRRAHGAAILTRGDFVIAKAETIKELPSHERGVSAAIRGSRGIGLNAVSWHAPNAAGQGVRFKMAGYAGIIAHLERLKGPVILGFDSNHWNLDTALAPNPPPEPGSSDWYLENLFFSASPPPRPSRRLSGLPRGQSDGACASP